MHERIPPHARRGNLLPTSAATGGGTSMHSPIRPCPLQAVAEEAGVPTRRLQQACEPWPLSFRNENCNGTAAVTVRAQLGAPLAPGSAPCLNGASQAGEWCVRTVELRPGQQQLVFPQVLNSTFQWYAELWGGNRTSPETPWYDVASGQPCEALPPTDTTSFTSCKPFSQVCAKCRVQVPCRWRRWQDQTAVKALCEARGCQLPCAPGRWQPQLCLPPVTPRYARHPRRRLTWRKRMQHASTHRLRCLLSCSATQHAAPICR